MDNTTGIFTTQKLQALIDFKINQEIQSRRDLARALTQKDERISIHGIEAWFKHVDSNYNLKRPSLSTSTEIPTYPIPRRRWGSLLVLFDLNQADLEYSDKEFREASSRRNFTGQGSTVGERRSRYRPAGLIGRENEFDKILQIVEKFRGGESRIVLVEGEAGNGKSRLLVELINSMEEVNQSYLAASCVEDCEAPLLPILDLIVMQVENKRSLDKRLADRFRGVTRGFDLSIESSNSIPRLFVELTSLLLELSSLEPLVVIIDDLHWVDESTARFLEHLLQNTSTNKEFRLLFIGTYRPLEITGRWYNTLGKLKNIQSISHVKLSALDQQDTYDFLDIQSGAPVSFRLKEFLWNMSLGNILFVQQVFEHLRKTDQLYSRHGYVDAVSYEKIDVPVDVHTVYMDRYYACTEPTRNLLDFCATLGIHFDLHKLQYTFRRFSLDAVIDCLEEAENAGLVVYKNDRFSFIHPIARHCIYSGLAETRRVRIHHSIAQRLYSSDDLISDQSNVEIALHLVKARPYADPKILVQSCYRAAFRSLALGAWDQVKLFAEVALSMHREQFLTVEEHSELSRIVGGSFHQSGNPHIAIEHLTLAYDGFMKMGNEVECARVLNEIARVRGNFGMTTSKDLSDIEELESYVPRLSSSNPNLAAWLLDTIATRYMYANKTRRAAESIEQALSLLKFREDQKEFSLLSITAGLIDLQRLNISSSLSRFENARYSAQQRGDKVTVIRVLQRIVIPQLLLGRINDVFPVIEEIRRNGNIAGKTGEFSLPLGVLVGALSLKGEFSQAEKVYLEGLELIKTSGYAWGAANLLGAFASVCVKQGRYDEAIKVSRYLIEDSNIGLIPKGFIKLQNQLELYISDLAGRGPGDDNTVNEVLMSDPGDDLDLGRLSRYAIGLELALKRDNEKQINIAFRALEFAHKNAIVFTVGWPFCVPMLLAKVSVRRGNLGLARYYLTIALDLCLHLSLTDELLAMSEYCQKLFPAEDVLVVRSQSGL